MLETDLLGVSARVHSDLERKILELCDLEKSRIGRDIHDGIGQLLTGVSLRSKALACRLRDKGLADEADDVRQLIILVDDVIKRIRDVVSGLAPSEIQNQDAATALRQLCLQVETLYHVRCAFIETSNIPMIEEPQAVKNLYFIAAESIHNAIRHGEADQIEVRLRQNDAAGHGELIIHNNGCCSPEDFHNLSGIGICGMKLRAQALNGNLFITQDLQKTVSVTCSFNIMEE